MRQRAMIAMALVHNPAILICDEPTTALDVTVQAQILELIEDVKREFDIGVILVTHDLGVVAETADSVIVMYAGRIDGVRPGERRSSTQPQHPYAWGLLDSMPTIERRLDVARADRRLAAVAARAAARLPVPSALPAPLRAVRRSNVPPLVAPAPDAHLDACHLPWDRQARDRQRARRSAGSEIAA